MPFHSSNRIPPSLLNTVIDMAINIQPILGLWSRSWQLLNEFLRSLFVLYQQNNEWKREVAFAGFDVPIQMDISAEKMLFGVPGVDPERIAELIKIYVAHGRLQLALPMVEIKAMTNLSLMRTVEKWLQKERDEERKKWKERKAMGCW